MSMLIPGLRSHFKKILASLRGLAVLLVLSAAPRLARTASLHFEMASKSWRHAVMVAQMIG
ncbi:hypothetical protein DDF84_027095 [Cupriavidus metallidurans]|uniref:Uncharacterized protein n=1 Tax=Cupriavidus metallidurans TaxID=119219 RepID=A0A482IXY9_9BURK|nr:hypothetical protein DDF84_027095 [Cupriavidus metallidurans]